MPVNFAEIKRRREARGLTMDEAAKASELDSMAGPNGRTRWSDLESGRYADPHILTLEGAARACACRVQDLLTDDTPGGPLPSRRRR